MTEPTVVLHADIETFVHAVGRQLADLPAEDRADLLDELREHANSIRAQDEAVNLAVRLGSPEAYAADLREAAEMPRTPKTTAGLPGSFRRSATRLTNAGFLPAHPSSHRRSAASRCSTGWLAARAADS